MELIKYITEKEKLTRISILVLQEFLNNNTEYLNIKAIATKIKADRTSVHNITTNFLYRNWIVKRQMNMDRGFRFEYMLSDYFYITIYDLICQDMGKFDKLKIEVKEKIENGTK